MKALGVSALCIWIAAILQQVVADRIAIFGARPDFLIIATVVLGLLLPSPGCIVAGFFSGVVQGAIIGANLAQYVLSRMVTAYAGSRVSDLEIEIGVALGALMVALGTLVAQLILMFLAPPRSLGGFVGDTIGSAVYNAVIAAPVYAVLRPILRNPRT